MDDLRVDRWLASLVSTPGLTAVRDPTEARRVHLDEALPGAVLLETGPVVDVGSGGGSPGIPLAAARPDLDVVLLEATRKKCDFLEEHARSFPNVSVLCARAEEHAAGAGREAYGAAVARALAAPAVALEWCLPLVRVGGLCLLYAGELPPGLAQVAAELGGAPPDLVPVPGSERRTLAVVRKLEPTPPRFPRRVGVAKKRPLG